MRTTPTNINNSNIKCFVKTLKLRSGKLFGRLCATLLCAVAVSFLVAPPAYAYVDPSVMTYTIQALAGVAVALSAVAGVAFRRTRKKIFKIFHIDEAANKITEKSVNRISPLNKEALHKADLEAVSELNTATNAKSTKKLKWSRRFLYALLASAFIVFTLCVASPIDIVANASSSLSLKMKDIIWPLVIFSATATLVLSLILSFFRGKAFDAIISLVVILGVCAWLQAMFMNTSLPQANGEIIDWGTHLDMTAISSIVWAALIVLAIIMALKKTSLCRGIAVFLCFGLIVIQSVGVASAIASGEKNITPVETGKNTGENLYITEDGLFEISQKNNVIVLCLDTFDNKIMSELVANDPSTLDNLTGFTYFPNSTGAMIPTSYAVPYLLTNELIRPNENDNQYYLEKWKRSSFINDIYSQGYSIGVYTDTLQNGIDYIADKSVNIHGVNVKTMNFGNAFIALTKCSLYREAPWVLKPLFWFSTNEINNMMSVESENPANTLYTMDDVKYYNKLKTKKLSFESNNSNGAFRFIHLNGTHVPYTVNENVEYVKESTVQQQAKASLKIVEEYIHQLKDMGVYDNTTIIITADHGYWFVPASDITTPVTPIMLVKPAQNDKDASSKCKVSDMPVSHKEFCATVIEGIGANSSKYGQTVFQIDDPNRIRTYITTLDNGNDVTDMVEWQIRGNCADFNNWSRTGNTWKLHQ